MKLEISLNAIFQKQDPAQFLRMYGRPVKIHLDQAVALAAEGPQSMCVICCH